MKLIPLGHDVTIGTQVCAPLEPLKVAAFGVSIGIFLLNQLF
jgi:hypothetical protein